MGPDLHRPQTLTPAFGGNRFLLPQDLDEDPLWWEPFHGPSQQHCWLPTPVCSPLPSNSASLHCPSILLFLFHSHFSTTYLFLLVLLAQGLWVSGMVLLRAMSHPYIMALSKGHLGMVCSTRPVLPWTGGHLRLGPCPGPMVPDWWSGQGLLLAPGLSEDSHEESSVLSSLLPRVQRPRWSILVSSLSADLGSYQGRCNTRWLVVSG